MFKSGLSEPDVQEARIGRSQHALMEITGLHKMKAMGGCVFSFSLDSYVQRKRKKHSVDAAVHWSGWILEESRSTFAADIEIKISENKEEFFYYSECNICLATDQSLRQNYQGELMVNL